MIIWGIPHEVMRNSSWYQDQRKVRYMDFTYLPTSEMDFLENTKYATDHKMCTQEAE